MTAHISTYGNDALNLKDTIASRKISLRLHGMYFLCPSRNSLPTLLKVLDSQNAKLPKHMTQQEISSPSGTSRFLKAPQSKFRSCCKASQNGTTSSTSSTSYCRNHHEALPKNLSSRKSCQSKHDQKHRQPVFSNARPSGISSC